MATEKTDAVFVGVGAAGGMLAAELQGDGSGEQLAVGSSDCDRVKPWKKQWSV